MAKPAEPAKRVVTAFLDREEDEWKKMEFSERLKKVREGRKLSKKRAAERSGVSTKTISNYEKGVKPSEKMVKKIANGLAVSPDFLLSGDLNHTVITQVELVGENGESKAIEAVKIFLSDRASKKNAFDFKYIYKRLTNEILDCFLEIYTENYL